MVQGFALTSREHPHQTQEILPWRGLNTLLSTSYITTDFSFAGFQKILNIKNAADVNHRLRTVWEITEGGGVRWSSTAVWNWTIC